ncbi:MAG: M20/M25/M40 family metallo-hydrolase [Armatimonadetes bacterium]|nr:M20/M25/M40 family metallo-hydrolase [Armatimonadota bacterium]
MIMNALLARIDPERIAALTLDLVRIPSPTGDTAAVAARFSAALAEAGMEVEQFTGFPRTPVVIGRRRGGPGPSLIFNGHLDTVPVPHADPERRGDRIYGRGAADMKGALAAAVEAVRVLSEHPGGFPGEVQIIAHGLHEAPGGHAEDLSAAIRAGRVRGDGCLVCETGEHALPVAQLGLGIFTAVFRRPGSVTHELQTPPGTPNPIYAAAAFAGALRLLNEHLSTRELPYVGSESVFIGQLHAGDFYNRFPIEAQIQGTRRYAPQRDADEVARELTDLAQRSAAQYGVTGELTFDKVRDGFQITPDHPLVQAVRDAYTAVTGRELPLTGNKVVADAGIFAREADIPAVYHGPAGEGAHGDVESVPIAELARAARVYVAAAWRFLGAEKGE